ncbi:WbqC family protein [Changchengzhania lutea]|uniref:WbqC family protein n=1 Tax=Changchengzhania lutea TaxID=2049305 RepID=UPI00115D96FC|nr:WbqC family protein [Changchengzhania lutea]
MRLLIHPTYFPNIAHFTAMSQAEHIVIEGEDNFLKQTYRNRTYIYGANGKLALSIPVIHSQNNRQKYRDVKISFDEPWQMHHWKSLLSAYRTSPFFEYYEDDLQALFLKKETFLFDFNLKCLDTVCECLALELKSTKTQTYEHQVEGIVDGRHLVYAKQETPKTFEKYTQVFDDKHGFLSNLSILDLLFNEGPNALNYLESQPINLQK